jgi:hypothetical protein
MPSLVVLVIVVIVQIVVVVAVYGRHDIDHRRHRDDRCREKGPKLESTRRFGYRRAVGTRLVLVKSQRHVLYMRGIAALEPTTGPKENVRKLRRHCTISHSCYCSDCCCCCCLW